MGFKILIVDECPLARSAMATAAVALEGFNAIGVASGFEALKLLPRDQFDLVIFDLHTQDIDALELLNFVKKSPKYRQTPMFLTAKVDEAPTRARGKALGAAEFLIKPLEAAALQELLRTYLHREERRTGRRRDQRQS